MSRPESQEFHFSPSSGFSLRDQYLNVNAHNALTSFPQPERRQSVAGLTPTYAGFGNSSIPRSSSLHESLFSYNSIAEMPGTNRNMPSLNSQQYNPSSRQSSPPSAKSHSSTPSTVVSGSGNSQYTTAGTSSIATTSNTSVEREGSVTKQGHHLSNPIPTPLANRSTLCWGELEPWMDEEYAKQVCGMMGWEPVSIKVPHPAPDPATGQHPNNPGYCYLTFPTPADAAAVLAQVNGTATARQTVPSTIPNSNKPFVMNWAPNLNNNNHAQSALSTTSYTAAHAHAHPPTQQYQKEYSIFVGDLAPETSNSDLVAVFRNPVLGLRSDREPKFIRPFLSCKSAKIMLDPVTGVSRGYGFVRFTDESDQQRALIEMHGLYCLSRPMRISPATAKFKPPHVPQIQYDMPSMPYTPPINPVGSNNASQSVTLALPLLDPSQAKSVSAPIAATGSSLSLNGTSTVSNSNSGSFTSGSNSSHSLTSDTASSASISSSNFGTDDTSLKSGGHANSAISPNSLAQLTQQYANNNDHSKLGYLNPGSYQEDDIRRLLTSYTAAHRYQLSQESLKHNAQARAILSNIMGPKGEQLTSTDPYNTTVFVGGLSPLISEETLRTFFSPFGDIHYVKVPAHKNCGFVQFVRKADAENAIAGMQGFPIGGSRIRLSWGRSQYKAAQAAAQAAQAAAIQSAYAAPPVFGSLTKDQALQILQSLGLNYPIPPGLRSTDGASHSSLDYSSHNAYMPNGFQSDAFKTAAIGMNSKDEVNNAFYNNLPESIRAQSNFSPFSPDPNSLYSSSESLRQQDPYGSSRLDSFGHSSKPYGYGLFSQPQDTTKMMNNTTTFSNAAESKVANAVRPTSATRYNFTENTDPLATIHGFSRGGGGGGRTDPNPISRPASGQLDCGRGDSGPIHDLNGTLASLDLDRPWRSPDVSRMKNGC